MLGILGALLWCCAWAQGSTDRLQWSRNAPGTAQTPPTPLHLNGFYNKQPHWDGAGQNGLWEERSRAVSPRVRLRVAVAAVHEHCIVGGNLRPLPLPALQGLHIYIHSLCSIRGLQQQCHALQEACHVPLAGSLKLARRIGSARYKQVLHAHPAQFRGALAQHHEQEWRN